MKKLSKTRLHSLVTNNIKNDIAQSNIAGASVLVAQGGEILLKECFGYADADGLTVQLCHKHHMRLHQQQEYQLELKQLAEEVWLEHYGKTVEDWIERYGKNFLD